MMNCSNSRFTMTALALSALAFLGGCDTATKLNDKAMAPVETRDALASGAGAAAAGGSGAAAAPQSSVATVDLNRGAGAGAAGATAAMAMPTQRVVYFDYDSYTIKDEFKGLIDTYARVLSADKAKKVVIEGHTDERGGREYNLALGQKRAAAVVQSLALLGASEGQMEAVSFGQERPAVQGSDESAWSKNRRAEVKDR
jgi:peptidoglycan-associated lipoprotein